MFRAGGAGVNRLIVTSPRCFMASPSNPSSSDSPEQFAAQMRQRAEEALSASVHHASLSQQYLTLSQKFAALAEQASSGTALGLAQTAAQLEREASTGVPANPIGLPQVAIGLPPIPQESSSGTPPISKPHFARDINAVRRRNRQPFEHQLDSMRVTYRRPKLLRCRTMRSRPATMRPGRPSIRRQHRHLPGNPRLHHPAPIENRLGRSERDSPSKSFSNARDSLLWRKPNAFG